MPVKKTTKISGKSKNNQSFSLQAEKKISNPGELFNLIKYLEAEKVDEFEYSEADFSVTLKRTVENSLNNGQHFAPGVLEALANGLKTSSTSKNIHISAHGPVKVKTESETSDSGQPAEDEAKFKFIESPIIGTFYRAPSPASPAYVENGQRVKKGQVVCIVEAMKLMNEIKSEYDGTVERICVENGTLVQSRQRLFYILPE